VRQPRDGHRVSQLSVLALGLSLYSYRVRELAACWLFFIILFVVLALLALGAVLAWYAGIHLSLRTRTTPPVSPLLVSTSLGVALEINSARVPAPPFPASTISQPRSTV